MSLTKEERAAILKAAEVETREGFAGEVSKRTRLTVAEVDALSKRPEERAALAKVIAEVSNATASNTSKADAIRKIQGGVEALVRLAGLLV